MKQLYLYCLLFTLACGSAFGQDNGAVDQLEFDKKTKKKEAADAAAKADSARKWHFGIISAATFNQSFQSNWSAGGNNAISLMGVLGLFVNYQNPKHYWFNLLDASYGLTKVDTLPFRKSQDYFEFNTKYGYRFAKQFSLTAFGEFVTQFAYNYDYKATPRPSRKDRISSIFAPAFLMQGIGLSYDHPKNIVSVRLAPLTAREVIVADPLVNEVNFGLDTGQVIKFQFGGSLRVNYIQEFWKKRITLESRLNIFQDYLKPAYGPYVNWRSKLDIKVLKVLSINLLLHIIYDPNTLFTKKTVTLPDGTVKVTEQDRRLQFLQVLGIGLGYTFVK
jgi:hypothetical protein